MMAWRIMDGAMRRPLVLCLLAGCAAPVGTAPPEADRSRQEAACARVVADHVGKPVAAVEATWRGPGGDGTTTVEARDGGRLHTCAVDAAGRVLRIDHPAE
jgi:hypothetical protein